jgi:hypothetical protein
MGSRDGAVGIATGYELDDGGVKGRVPVGPKIFPHVFQTGSSPFPSLSNVYRVLFSRE